MGVLVSCQCSDTESWSAHEYSACGKLCSEHKSDTGMLRNISRTTKLSISIESPARLPLWFQTRADGHVELQKVHGLDYSQREEVV